MCVPGKRFTFLEPISKLISIKISRKFFVYIYLNNFTFRNTSRRSWYPYFVQYVLCKHPTITLKNLKNVY